MAGRMLYIRALSPIHSGTGQSTGVIDLPVAREKITDWPYLPGSSLKGVLRDACDPGGDFDEKNPRPFDRAFGPPTNFADKYAGALTFCDAHLLCLPVRSFYGAFAWITCPLALDRWKEDAAAARAALTVTVPGAPPADHLLLAPSTKLTGGGDKVYLEDLDLTREDDAERQQAAAAVAATIASAVFPDAAWQTTFVERFGIVGDDLFTALTLTGTEVAARIVLSDASKTVENLWYEEAVPAQAIFAAPVLAESRLLNGAEPWTLFTAPLTDPRQIGGNASVGRGLAWLRLSPNGADGGTA
ncbi:MAG: type III-B CRISPR module RAMP protein Cmr4 [Thermomicrobiales bacterium]